MADLDRQGASYTRGIRLDVGGRATTAPAGDEGAGPLADGHNQEVTHREGLGNFTYLINAGDTAANDTAPGDRTATAVQDVAPARECNVCLTRTLRCAHFDGHTVALVKAHEHTGMAGGYGVLIDEMPPCTCHCGEPCYWASQAQWQGSDLDAATAAFDDAVDRLRSEALP